MDFDFGWHKRSTLPRDEKVLIIYKDPRNGRPNHAIGRKTIANRDFPYEIFSLEGGGALRLELILCWTKLTFPDLLDEWIKENSD